MSTLDQTQGFDVGDRVRYEVAKKNGDSWQVWATVIATTPRRVVVEFSHWADGRPVRRAARPYRLSAAA